MLTKLAASRFFTFSLLSHLLLIVLVGGYVFGRTTQPKTVFTGTPVPPVQDVKEPGPQLNEGAASSSSFLPGAPTLVSGPADLEMISVLAAVPTNTFLSGPVIDGPVLPLPPRGPDGPTSPNHGPLSRTAEGIQKGLDENGGKPASQNAVLRGLRWLSDHQNKDGSWGVKYKGAMTGYALLAFLGHGEGVESPAFGGNVRNGMERLIEEGERKQGRLSFSSRWEGNQAPYEHGVATYALAELYTFTHEPRIIPVLTEAVAHITAGQNPDGGWDYGYATGSKRTDLSVSGWNIQALKAAHVTGLKLPGVDQALDRAMPMVKRLQGKEGGFGYVKAENRYSLTGVGVLALQMWKPDSRAIRAGVDFILDGPKVDYDGADADLYAWYYHTQACFQKGDDAWKKWNVVWQPEIVGHQSADGSWPPIKPQKRPPGGELQVAGLEGDAPIYRTSLCVLMLEVFYRYEKGGTL